MPSLADFRHLLSLEVGPYIGPDIYDVRATGGSALNKLVCDAYPVLSGIPQDNSLVDRPLYRPQAVQPTDRHRYIQAYAPATGTITPDLDWAVSPVPVTGGSTYDALEAFTYDELELQIYDDLEDLGLTGFGERFEVLGPFDAPTLHQIINDGLKQCWIIVEVVCLPSPQATLI